MVNAWYVDAPPKIEPHSEGEFIGKVSRRGLRPILNVFILIHMLTGNPLPNVLGILRRWVLLVNKSLSKYFSFIWSEVITSGARKKINGDFWLSPKNNYSNVPMEIKGKQ